MRWSLPLAFTLLVACSSEPAGTSDTGSGTTDSSTALDVGAGDSGGQPETSLMIDTGTAADSTAIDAVDAATDTMTAMDSAPGDAGPPDISKARIHELYVDRALEGDKVEYVEIAAPAGTPLDNLWLRHIDDKGAAVFELRVGDAGAKMNASGYWVVGAATVTKVDKSYSLSQWGLTNAGGSVQLLRKDVASAPLDVVGYGAAPAMATAAPTKTIEGSAATVPMSGVKGKSIGRKSIPGDTDNNSADFCVQNASPGAANGACS